MSLTARVTSAGFYPFNSINPRIAAAEFYVFSGHDDILDLLQDILTILQAMMAFMQSCGLNIDEILRRLRLLDANNNINKDLINRIHTQLCRKL